MAKNSCGNSLPGLIKVRGEGGKGMGGLSFSYTFESVKSLSDLNYTSTCFIFDYSVTVHCLTLLLFYAFPDTY